MSDPLAKLRESLKSGKPIAPRPTTGPIVAGDRYGHTGKADPLAALRQQVKLGEKLPIAPAGPQLTDALKSLEGRLLTAIATVNGHGHPLQYASDVLAALKKITPA